MENQGNRGSEVSVMEDGIQINQTPIRRRRSRDMNTEMVTVNQGNIRAEIATANDGLSVLDSVNEGVQEKLIGIATQVWEKLRGIRKNIYEIGRLLSEAENTFIKHGQFIPWIEQTFGNQLPYSTAWLYMKIYNEYKEKPEMYQYPITVLQYMIQKDYPEEVKTMLEDHCEEMAGVINVKKHTKGLADVKKGEKKPDEFWEEIKGSLDVTSLRNNDLKKSFDQYREQMKIGFSRIDKGISLIKMKPRYAEVIPGTIFRDYYIKECDEKIERLQKRKAEFLAEFDNPPDLQLVESLPERQVVNL